MTLKPGMRICLEQASSFLLRLDPIFDLNFIIRTAGPLSHLTCLRKFPPYLLRASGELLLSSLLKLFLEPELLLLPLLRLLLVLSDLQNLCITAFWGTLPISSQ